MVQQENPRLVEPIQSSLGELKPRKTWVWKWAIALAAVAGGVSLYGVLKSGSVAHSPTPTHLPAVKVPASQAVAALGRLEPVGEVTRLSVFNSLEGARVERLLVKEGDRVSAGQVVVVLSTYESRAATLLKAQSQVDVAQAALDKVKAGAKIGDIDAQKAAIERLKAQLANAKLEYDRNQSLYESGAVSASARDSKQLDMETIQAQLDQAKASLNSVAEVRPVDVKEAEIQVQSAVAAKKEAEANLELTYVRSPINGRVLKIHTRPGEIIGNDGIAELGQTDRMYAVAQVYETDIGKIKPGQIAVVTSDAISQKLKGTVDQIGLKVTQQNTFTVNPMAETDRRVIEVKVLLDPDSSHKVASLTNLQVQVIFKP